MDKVKQAERFLEVVASNYEDCKRKWSKYQNDKHREFDVDVYGNTIVNIYNYILQNGISDDSDEGLLNYFFRSFQTNTLREHQYAENSKRDKGKDPFSYLNDREDDSDISTMKKEEALKHYLIYHTLLAVQENFDPIDFGCFRIYYLLDKMTYSKLKKITKVKDCKTRVVKIRKWLQDNLDKKKLIKDFETWYEYEKNLFW